MHSNSSADQRAYPDTITDHASPWQRSGSRWFLLLTLLLTLRVGATPLGPKESLPHLGSGHSSAPTTLASEQQVARLLQQGATVLTASQPRQQLAALAMTQAQRLASQRSERWLSQFGRARVNLGSNERFKQFHGELAVLLPLDESSARPLTFSQLGIHYYDSQPVANIGLGQRHFIQEWLFGYNAFLDQHLKRGHSRLGVGAELWRDYLKFSANGYFAVGSWKASKTVEGYQEKVASGFDLRLQGYWPDHPQLGAQLLFENYFGDQVALFDKQREDWQKNPLAATLGIHYTPVPLFTIGVDHKIGRQSKKETRLTLQFDYLLDLPWEYQINPHKVAASRTLAMNQYDWVQRNNRLILQYRQLAPISLVLPPADQLVGVSEETIPLEATVEARFGFKEINWDSEKLTAAGGRIEHLGGTRYQVILPKSEGLYPLIGIAVDQQGNQSTAATTAITVKYPITLTLPAQVFVSPETATSFEAKVDAHYGFKEIKVVGLGESDALTTQFLGDGRYQVTLPGVPAGSESEIESESKTVTFAAYDKKGYRTTASTIITITQPDTVTLILPTEVSGKGGDVNVPLEVKVSAPKGFSKIRWEAAEFKKDGGELFAAPGEEHEHWSLALPNQEKTYVITGTAVDKAGNQSSPATVKVKVTVEKAPELPELKIQGPDKLSTARLQGETLSLTATGGDGQYKWKSTDLKVATIKDDGKGHCDVTIEGGGSAIIQVTSAGATASYTELEGAQPLLKAMDNTTRNYQEAEDFCKKNKASLPTQKILEGILKARQPAVELWARKTFHPTGGQALAIWLKDEKTGEDFEEKSRPIINLETKEYQGAIDASKPLYTICQFNP